MHSDEKIFVYGTLKQGCYASDLMGASRLVDPDYKLMGHRLWNGWSFPMVVKGDADNFVVGEVYEVDAVTIKKLDQYEGHPNLFKRTPVGGASGLSFYEYQQEIPADAEVAEDGVFLPRH